MRNPHTTSNKNYLFCCCCLQAVSPPLTLVARPPRLAGERTRRARRFALLLLLLFSVVEVIPLILDMVFWRMLDERCAEAWTTAFRLWPGVGLFTLAVFGP